MVNIRKSLSFRNLVQYEINKKLQRGDGWCCGVVNVECCEVKSGVLTQSHDPRDFLKVDFCKVKP